MAEQAGPIGWNLDGIQILSEQERKDIEEQAKQFAEMHLDALGPLMQRVEQLKQEGQADSLYMMASIILTTGNSLLAYIKSAEAAKAEAESGDDGAKS